VATGLDNDPLSLYSVNLVSSWDDANREHVAKHAVSPEEAEYVVRHAANPFPQTIEDDKFVVWGATETGRHLQVIYVLKMPGEVSYESLSVGDWMAIEAGEFAEVVRVIHAMDLTERMKRSLRKRRR
jgi:uncharacterized DUF497 family protein